MASLQPGAGFAALPPLALGLLALAAPAVPAAAGELRVVVEATAGLREDGNYFQSAVVPPESAPEDPESPDPTREELEAQVAVAGLRTSLSYQLPRSAVALVYSPTWEVNLDNRDFDEVAHRLDLGYTRDVSRTSRLSLRERLLYSSDVELSPAFLDDTLVVTPRGNQLRHSLGLDVGSDLSRRWRLGFGATHTYRDYDSPELVDTGSAGATVGLQCALDPQSAWGFGAGYHRYDYAGRTDDVASVFATYRIELMRGLDLDVTAGAFHLQRSRERPAGGPAPLPGSPPVTVVTEEERDGWQGGLGLAGLRPRFSWSLGYDHGVNPGYALGRSVESDRVRVAVNVPLARRFGFGLSGTGTQNRDVGAPGRAIGDQLDINRFAAGALTAGWGFADWGRLSGSYSYVWQESDVAALGDLSYDRFTLGIALRLYASGEAPYEPGKEGEARDDDPDVP